MKKPALIIAALSLLLTVGVLRVGPVQAQDEQEQEQEQEEPPYQPAQEAVDPQQVQQQRQEQTCIITGACTCSFGMCTSNATGARFRAPGPAFAGEWYAAIAKSASSAAWGASWHYASQAAADQAALANCNKDGVTDCAVQIGDVNNCLSLAESPEGTWGVGRSGLNRADAIYVATGYCRKYGGKNCVAQVSVCGRQPKDSKPCLQVGSGIDISHWSAAALANLTPAEREAFAHPAQHTNGACK